jgi:hypothetical protein
MFDEHTTSPGGEVIEKPKVKKLTKKEKLAAFRNEHAVALGEARLACCVCTPTRAQVLLVDKAEGLRPLDD